MPNFVVGEVAKTGRGCDVFSFEWRIPDYLSLDRACFFSRSFHCWGAKWFLSVLRKSVRGAHTSENLTLILYRKDRGPPETFNVTIGIRGMEGVENRKKRRQEFSRGDHSCIWNSFCRKEHASKLMSGNTLVISLDIGRDKHSGTKGVEEWQESLLKLLESGEGSDVLIKVRDREFRAHRILLQARSTVFGAMFSHDMVEKQSGVVTMEDCDPDTFPDFLKYIYTSCTDVVCAENVFGLYSASDKYDLNALKEKCADFMKNNIDVANFCETITLAVKHDEKELTEVAKQFFCANTLDIVKTVEWQTFLAENLTFGNELFVLSCSLKKSLLKKKKKINVSNSY